VNFVTMPFTSFQLTNFSDEMQSLLPLVLKTKVRKKKKEGEQGALFFQ
jgi:hypothetical protein